MVQGTTQAKARARNKKDGERSFRATITRSGGAYVVDIPKGVSDAFGKGRVPVIARVDDGEIFHGTLMPAGGGRHYLMIGRRAREGAKSSRVVIRIRPNDPHRKVAIPPDLAAALEEAGARSGWELLPPGKREHIISYIDMAAHEATREKRIAQAVQMAEERREKSVDRAERRQKRQ
ncbi:MAG: YdeI/OmpD-associated family protein [Polyangiaceae bacterium]